MKIAFFSAKSYEQPFFEQANEGLGHEFKFIDCHLERSTVEFAQDCQAVCVFVNDDLSRCTLLKLKEQGVKLIALRCAGYNNVDLDSAAELGLDVVRVPSYSPDAVAEHAIALILTLNRKTHKAYNRTREANFSIDGLMGFDLKGKTVGIFGLGQIGHSFAERMAAFGCKILVHDPYLNEITHDYDLVTSCEIFKQADIISLHCPLTPETHHMIDSKAIQAMKPGVMLINTSRGAVVDTKSVIQGLKTGHIGYFALDVYEEEADYFFEDLSNTVVCDDSLARLMTFPNVLITGHQAFFTQEAMEQIAQTTMNSVEDSAQGRKLANQVTAPLRTVVV
ncbi:MAG: 2-hydroxyacid dehydrogenase [Candidatus Melainabacteria bacterium]|nr:2-hydroxyacid dehydrogenase [Candidatus Melainabacteria bacterium]